MKQLFPSNLRRIHGLSQLQTIKVHTACNSAYQEDEDYFVNTWFPFFRGSYVGDAIYAEMFGRYRKGRFRGLVRKVMGEFDPNPSGLILPNLVVKRFDGTRSRRIAWKIVRGLYFHHNGIVLPEDLSNVSSKIEFHHAVESKEPPEHFKMFMSLPAEENPAHGLYPGAFTYRFQVFSEGGSTMHYWALLIADRLLITAMFHDPACACGPCMELRKPAA